MSRRQFIRLLGGGTVAAATFSLGGCISSDLPSQAVEAWKGPQANETEPRRRALAYAITAPNPHNLQPWLVDLREANVITLRTDPQRVLPETDPFGRQIMVGHGTFLELLVIALAEQGLRADVQLWPQGEMPAELKDWRAAMKLPVARITLTSAPAVAQKDALFAHILNRHTVKVNFDTTKSVSEANLQNILKANSASRMQSGGTVQEQRLEALRKLCVDSAFVELRTPRTNLESIKLARVGPDEILQNRDGISINSPMVRALTAFGQFDRSIPTPPGSTAEKKFIERFDGTSKTAMGFVWIAGKTVQWFGNLDTPHTFTFVPDFGKALVELGVDGKGWGEAWHVPQCITCTGREAAEAVAKLVKKPARLTRMGTWMLHIIGIFMPQAKEMIEMLPHFETPYVVDDSKWRSRMHTRATPWDVALAETVFSYP